ncbi:membrane protein DedA with SNARE-associated domain [Arcanobacterium wilhelmae]|uniref:Membrane protein DedA with SNARE-associated domain n=1 Tax=Arcanobacterium wilhelmae TaxID=1803177 RepID=A0ABT9NBJ0_9ACTO|nr:DedA family protein [Arcanobacterium wilhelmae]MDP9801073.1 membrane protein DedA with SNARE-associated domain [Arcanobacterium wilhelmae]WFN90429.1 DedA family protein [Arcanobacterium wilhelmae]
MFAKLFALQAAQTAADSLSGIAAWAVSVMDALGGPGIAFIIALENLFPPLPSEVFLPLAGFTAKQGNAFSLVGAIVWATIGSVLGAIILYWIARWFGRERTRLFMSKIPFMKMSDVDKTEAFFTKYSGPTVFFGRCLPIFRSLISLPAGVVKEPFGKFVVLTAAGSAIWNTALISAGYALGANWNKVEGVVSQFSTVIAVIVVLAIVSWFVIRIWKRNSRKG